MERVIKGKGKGKNNAGGKGMKGGKVDLPDGIKLAPSHKGKPICFRYGESKCSNKKCAMLHICQICKLEHPWTECDTIQE